MRHRVVIGHGVPAVRCGVWIRGQNGHALGEPAGSNVIALVAVVGVGVVLVLHGRGVLGDVEDGRVRLAVNHALAGCVLCPGGSGWRAVGVSWGGPLCPQPIARAVLGSRSCISMLDELQSANV